MIDHIGLTVSDLPRAQAFYAAARGTGGRDRGAPGPRPHDHAHYYGACGLAPDAHNLRGGVP